MADRKLFFTVGADVAPGSKAFSQLARDAKKSMGDVDTALEDTESAGKQLALALEAQFEAIDSSIEETKATAEVLATALGPELSAKIDSTAVVGEFTKLGLTLDEIKADADALATALKKADDVSLKHLGDSTADTDTKMKGLRDSSDQSRSVLANVAGNSAQDLGAVGGVAGTAGVAFGQLAEYATEGNISLRGLAGVAGPMALVTVAVMGITAGMEAMAKVKAFEKERVDDYIDALGKGEDAVLALTERLKEAGEVKFTEEGLFGNDWFGRVSDAKFAIGNAGLSFDEFAEIVGEGEDAIKAWGESALREGKNAEDVKYTLEAMNQELQAQRDAANEAAGMNQLNERSIKSVDEAMQAWIKSADPVKGMPEDFRKVSEGLKGVKEDGVATKDATDALNRIMRDTGMTMDEVFDAASKLTPEVDVLAKQQERAAETSDRMRDSLLEQVGALEATMQATMNAADASIAADDAQSEFIDAVEESTTVQGDAEASTDDLRDAVNAERDAMRNAADAAVNLKDEQAKANGTTLTAKDRIDAFNDSLISNSKFATPAAKQAIADYIIEANGVPETKATAIRAAITAGDIPEVHRLLNEASATRNAAIQADLIGEQAVEDQLKWLARDRWATIRVAGGPSGGDERTAAATGGTRSGVTLVGEKGPELVDLPNGSYVHTAPETKRMLNGGPGSPIVAGGGSTINVVVAAPLGGSPYEFGRRVAEAIRKRERYNGRVA